MSGRQQGACGLVGNNTLVTVGGHGPHGAVRASQLVKFTYNPGPALALHANLGKQGAHATEGTLSASSCAQQVALTSASHIGESYRLIIKCSVQPLLLCRDFRGSVADHYRQWIGPFRSVDTRESTIFLVCNDLTRLQQRTLKLALIEAAGGIWR